MFFDFSIKIKILFYDIQERIILIELKKLALKKT